MESAQPKVLYTPEEYLAMERTSLTRHEFVDGVIYAMAGESQAHSQICVNLAGEVRAKLKGGNCQALSPDMKVRAENKKMFAYLDLIVVCGEPQFYDEQRDVLLNPKVIFEVYSPLTERYDQRKKFFRYHQELTSLTDYVLIYQHAPVIEHYEKTTGGRRTINPSYGIDNVLRIASIEIELSLRQIYDRVEFPEENLDEDEW